MSNQYTNLARQAISEYLKTETVISPPNDLPPALLNEESGVFVTLETKSGKLRGCIGTYLPTRRNIATEIIDNAIAAATRDYRFSPLFPEELDNINITVSILQKPEQVKTLKQLDVKKYGVIVKTKDGRSGLLLPDIETIDTADKQVAIAAQKGGIDLSRDNVYLFRFEVTKHSDEK